ncbi:MAG TPA: HAMP domain-containing protein [Gammaproteobacteria bacterium]|nr:HAMP domain-containing protein [Gammaproteobacteria bacterium]
MAKIKFGLYARIAFSVILIISLAMFILGFYLISDAREKFNKERLQQVTASAMTLANGSRDALISDDYELLDFWLRSVLVRDYYAYAYFSRADGVILSHTDMGMVAKKVKALGQLTKVAKRKMLYHGHPVMEVVYPSRLGGRYLGNAHVAYYLDQDTFSDTYNINNIILLVFVLLGCLLIAILYIVRRYTIPVSQLTDYVASLSVDDIYRKPDSALLDNHTEVGDLARAFNDMSQRLMTAFQELVDEEAHLKELVEDRTRSLLAANRELESFSHSVSHDLRAPLRAIDGFTQILEEDYIHLLDEDGRHYLQRIRSGVKRMNELIDDLLQLSRINRRKLDTVRLEIGKMVRNISENMRESDSRRKVKFIIDDKLHADADARLLQIALENILANAWKYTGKVEHAVIEFGMQREGSEDVFYIRDNGAGFDMAYVDKLFAVFERLHKDDDFEGSGVGLATVERIIRRHGGRIWAQAEPGKGAVFFFTLRAAVPYE